MRTNQNSTPNPSPEGDQSDPETPVFRIFPAGIPYISNVTQSLGLLPIAAAWYWWEPQRELGNKNSLAFALDIGSLVVIGRFRDLGITQIAVLGPGTCLLASQSNWRMVAEQRSARTWQKALGCLVIFVFFF